jgi:hypothetical protein
MSADIVHRLTLWAANQSITLSTIGGAQLALEAAAHIEALRREVRTQRAEIAQHISVRNAILDMDKPPEHGSISLEDK